MVAQCDANDPTTLVHGILLSLAEASRSDEQPREVSLTLCHRGMQAFFPSFGFRRAGVDGCSIWEHSGAALTYRPIHRTGL